MIIEVIVDRYGNKLPYYPKGADIIPKDYLISKLEEFKYLLERQLSSETGLDYTQEYFENIPNGINTINQMLVWFKTHESDSFRIHNEINNRVKEFESGGDYLQALKLFCEQLFFEGTLKETWYDVELSLTKGATIKPEVINIPAYISATLTSGLTYSYQAAGAISLAEITANYINTSCRIFKCKDCGKLAYVRKEDDEDKCSKGMKPVKRCVACRAFKRDKDKLDRLTNYFN